MKARQRTFRSSSISVIAAFVGIGACDTSGPHGDCIEVSCNPEFPTDDESDEEEGAGKIRADGGSDAGKDASKEAAPESHRDASTDAGSACPAVRPAAGADCSYAAICVYEWCAYDGQPTVEALCENKRTKLRMISCNPPFGIDGGPPPIDAGPAPSSDGSVDGSSDARASAANAS